MDMNRRQWLRWGGLGLFGLGMPQLLRAEDRSVKVGISSPHNPGFGRARRCILIFLKGGPSHLDTFDMKPDAPAEVRGELRPISTSVPGIQICEHLPHLARQVNKFRIVRSLWHGDDGHPSAAYEMTTGRPYPRARNQSEISSRDDHPHLGSSIAALETRRRRAPPFAMVPDYFVVNGQFRSGQNAGFLGSRYDPLVPHADPNGAGFAAVDLGFTLRIESVRMQTRQALLDSLKIPSDTVTSAPAVREFTDYRRQAHDILNTGRVRHAFDLDRESSATRDRYGRNFFGQSTLLARRLVEAGVRLVHVNCMSSTMGGGVTWDTHKDNFKHLKETLLPRADCGIAALLEDLGASGLLSETLVVVTGEFGRTPKVNKDAGRDHWPSAFSVLLAGAGIPGGTVYGATDKQGAYPTEGRIRSGQFASSVFHALGVDPKTQITLSAGRPWAISDDTPVPELWVS
jgi:hypothetical protein